MYAQQILLLNNKYTMKGTETKPIKQPGKKGTNILVIKLNCQPMWYDMIVLVVLFLFTNFLFIKIVIDAVPNQRHWYFASLITKMLQHFILIRNKTVFLATFTSFRWYISPRNNRQLLQYCSGGRRHTTTTEKITQNKIKWADTTHAR